MSAINKRLLTGIAITIAIITVASIVIITQTPNFGVDIYALTLDEVRDELKFFGNKNIGDFVYENGNQKYPLWQPPLPRMYVCDNSDCDDVMPIDMTNFGSERVNYTHGRHDREIWSWVNVHGVLTSSNMPDEEVIITPLYIEFCKKDSLGYSSFSYNCPVIKANPP